MTRILLVIFTAASVMFGQSATKADLLQRVDAIQAAIAAGDWSKAAAISSALKDDLTTARNASLSAGSNEFAGSLLRWLPPDVETLVIARDPFGVPQAGKTAHLPSSLESAQKYVMILLAAAENQKLAAALQGRTIASAGIAARHFHNHSADDRGILPLGLIAFEGCAFYRFTSPVSESLLGRAPDDAALGHRIWTSKGSMSDAKDTETFLVAFLEPDLLSVCNDRSFFETVASRMSMPQQPRALPQELGEWQWLDRTAPVWGISHYATDSLAASALEGVSAVGVAFDIGKPKGTAIIRMISKSDPWAAMSGTDDLGDTKSRKIGPEVWELSIAETQQSSPLSTMMLMSLAGFVILL